MSVQLRNRIKAATDLPLSATLAFSYPSVTALAAHVHGALDLGRAGTASVAEELDRLEDALRRTTPGAGGRADVRRRLSALLSQWDDPAEAAPGAAVGRAAVESATAEEIFDLIDRELGSS
jgi:hypothetical protein